MVEVRSAIAGAVAGALTTVAVGPVLEFKIGQYLSASAWEGEWQTITCTMDGNDATWTVTFEQQGNKVTGHYLGTSVNAQGFFGVLAGTIEVERLFGTWTQTSSYGKQGGPFDFILVEGGKAFIGSHRENLNGENLVWFGRRDGSQPKCR